MKRSRRHGGPQGRRGDGLVPMTILVVLVAVLLLRPWNLFVDATPIAPSVQARMDLETVGRAIALYEEQTGLYTADDLGPLLGRYLQERPRDPWGRLYLVEARSRRIGCLGRDGRAGGIGANQDIWIELGPCPPAP